MVQEESHSSEVDTTNAEEVPFGAYIYEIPEAVGKKTIGEVLKSFDNQILNEKEFDTLVDWLKANRGNPSAEEIIQGLGRWDKRPLLACYMKPRGKFATYLTRNPWGGLWDGGSLVSDNWDENDRVFLRG